MKASTWIAIGIAGGLAAGAAWAMEDDDGDIVLSEQEVAKFLLDHELGHMVEELREVRREEPEEYEEMLFDISEHILEYRELKEYAPKVANAMLKAEQLEHKSWVIAEKLEGADSADEKEQLKKELYGVLSEAFDARLEEGEFELREIEKELTEIRSSLDRRKSNREKIIQRRMEQILSEFDDDLRW